MNENYDNQKLAAYLLGTLPETEAEVFDELSLTDDAFANQLSAAESDLVDAFVNNELRGATLEQFKSYYLASPLRREKVQFAQAFQEFAKQSNEPKTVGLVEVKPPPAAGFFANFFKMSRSSLQWSLAFAVLALIIFGGIWLYSENSRLRFQMEQAQTNRDELQKRESDLQQREKQLQDEIAAQQTDNSEANAELAEIREEREQLEQKLKQTKQRRITEGQNEQRADAKQQPPSAPIRQPLVASFILTQPLRGNNQLETISIPAKTDSVSVRLQLESDDYPVYRVALRSQTDNRILWQSGKIKTKTSGANKSLNVNFPARLLHSAIYSLEVLGIPANGSPETISDYSFKVMP